MCGMEKFGQFLPVAVDLELPCSQGVGKSQAEHCFCEPHLCPGGSDRLNLLELCELGCHCGGAYYSCDVSIGAPMTLAQPIVLPSHCQAGNWPNSPVEWPDEPSLSLIVLFIGGGPDHSTIPWRATTDLVMMNDGSDDLRKWKWRKQWANQFPQAVNPGGLLKWVKSVYLYVCD